MRTYLTKAGTVRNMTHKEIGASWREMNEARVQYATKEEIEFLKNYGLKSTIFNVANLRKWGVVEISPHFVDVVLSFGAVDMRDKKEGD